MSSQVKIQGNFIYETKLIANFLCDECIAASEVTLATHRVHPLIIAWISFHLCSLSQKILAQFKSSQYPTEDPHLVPKS